MRPRTLALQRLRRWRPTALERVIATLRRAGGQAYIVGGVVRDAFLNRRGGDWDVATDLAPARVASLFPNVVRAGEKHGTIMVIESGTPIEVTTFRGEGPYLDGRRPSFVEFHRDIERDLARRDFTMNAIAVNLEASEWVDPFQGIDAVRARRIACVGDALERFREDGLRPLRAVRFASTLEFEVEATTEAALGAELRTFDRVAWERKRVELEKLLAGPGVQRALSLLESSGLRGALLPELRADGVPLDALARLPADPWLRLTAWASQAELEPSAVRAVLTRLKVSSATQRRVEAWYRATTASRGAPPTDGVSFRRWLADVGIEGARGALEIAVARGHLERALAQRIRRALRRPPAHRIPDLAVRGRDLLALGLEGPQVGEVLARLLELVIVEPRRNRRDVLLAAAHRLSTPARGREDR